MRVIVLSIPVYLTANGSLHGAFFGITPTGQLTRFHGVYHCRIRNRQIVEDWDVFDLLSAAFQLGATLQSNAAAEQPGT